MIFLFKQNKDYNSNVNILLKYHTHISSTLDAHVAEQCIDEMQKNSESWQCCQRVASRIKQIVEYEESVHRDCHAADDVSIGEGEPRIILFNF